MEKHPQPPSQPHNPRHLHVAAFAQEGSTLEGTSILQDFPRLRMESPHAAVQTPVQWHAQARVDQSPGQAPAIRLDLHACATLPVLCQRCLQPMEETITVNRTFRFAHDEASAARLDEELEEDVLVCSRQFDLLNLVEDELLMALPLAPRHAICQPATALLDPAVESDPQPHPFAALQQLKKNPPR
jgi:uncharacterized protein